MALGSDPEVNSLTQFYQDLTQVLVDQGYSQKNAEIEAEKIAEGVKAGQINITEIDSFYGTALDSEYDESQFDENSPLFEDTMTDTSQFYGTSGMLSQGSQELSGDVLDQGDADARTGQPDQEGRGPYRWRREDTI